MKNEEVVGKPNEEDGQDGVVDTPRRGIQGMTV